ncbi:hypothetical protein MKX01_017238 [Papaver californicum]|nr:hypothetical protein MKX01_017238 [Papaver californicum]
METSTFDQSTGEGGEATSVMMQQAQEKITQQEVMPPVLAEKKKPLKVLVAIDDSEGSFYALKWALGNLFASDAASSAAPDQTQNLGMLYLLNVQQPFNTTSFLLALVKKKQQILYIFLKITVYATTSVIESVRKAQEQNSTMVKVETLMMEGDTKDMICQAAEQMHADLVVVGSRGLGKIKRLTKITL